MRFCHGLLALALALASGTALANGRAPGTSTINFERNNEGHIAAGMTFGVVLTNDNGATWTWMCEEAVGYGGMYDPDYAFTSTGALFATTFDGLKVNRDGCVYNASTLSPAPPDLKFFSSITVSQADGAVYAAAADPADDQIYKSTDDGATFPVHPIPQGAMLNDWYQSIEVAPSDANTVYVTGYRLQQGNPKQFLLYKSTDGGASYQTLPGSGQSSNVNGIATMPNSTIEIASVSKTNKNLLYVRVTLADNATSDAIYRSRDGGQSWDKLMEKAAQIAFVARANGDLVAGTQALGSFKASDDGSATVPVFTDLTGAPHINCLGENSAGEVWACTQNYGAAGVPTDSFGIMKTTDLVTWTGVLKFQDLADPQSCAAGTTQKDRCDSELWCGLCAQLGCDPGRNCATGGDSPGGDVTTKPPKGCCQAGNDGIPGLLLIGITLGLVLLRRRRPTA